MENKNFWTKINKENSKLPNSFVLIEGYFSKKGSFINSKRYFRLYESFLYYFEEINSETPKGYVIVDFDLNF